MTRWTLAAYYIDGIVPRRDYQLFTSGRYRILRDINLIDGET